MFTEQGYIRHLFIKQQHKSTMTSVEKINLKIVHGIEEDINANPISPRQILIVRYEDILEFAIPPGELRENIVISGIKAENFTPGSVISFDSGAAIRLTFYCEPCKRIAHLVDSLKHLQAKRGILGVVINSGTINVGNSVYIQTDKFPALPEKPYERFLEFIVKVPAGKVVTYKQIIQAIGVDNSYLRAIPIYLKKTSAEDYPIHRILDSQGYLIKYVSNQKRKLELEDVKILAHLDLSSGSNKYFVDFSKYLYQIHELFLY
ncbi:MAG: MGMT family protein [Mojavia pulchra JT2-VF2]|jgi:alkylated DNA nucleotide flippase Atl1|uniref:MGMT family protein n=1 Tax=Mojavia pulchra JT2-VF2 TaxID=287848 RepID=A0A951Q462_9NOST|nr:MGMT family protein [Mojavia pulchra JT2-VF2]